MTYRSQSKQLRTVLFFCVSFLLVHINVYAGSHFALQVSTTDSLPEKQSAVNSDTTIDGNLSNNHFIGLEIDAINQMDTVSIRAVTRQPFISLQQMLKGNVAGTYVQEPSGEPGTHQYIFIRGLSSPLLGKKDLINSQPAIYVNGIPLTHASPFAFDIQKYDFNRIGPATNYLADLTASDITSIKVIKDPAALATLGPEAANGAIWVTTKNAHSGYREISINSYVGFAQKPVVTPVNAAYENAFRQPFYDKYGTLADRLRYPAYLRDSTNRAYYGPSNWIDLYYQNKPLYSIDLSLTGGSERANFRFLATNAQSNGNADGTSLNRYGVSFFINMLPLKWMTVSAMVRANRLERDRNRSVRDRIAEQRYLPDLTNPLSPNKSVYARYLSVFNDDVVDENKTNTVQGYFGLKMSFDKLEYNGKIAVVYNEGLRNAFWPTTLLEGHNFVSNYFGYNQRFIVSNSLNYHFDFGSRSRLSLQAGQELYEDIYKYDYGYAYNGPNDFIKVNAVDGNPNHEDYLDPVTWDAQRYPDKMTPRLASYYFKAGYEINDVNIGAVIRSDGSSNVQPDHRWLLTYAFSGNWDIQNALLAESNISTLNLRASYAKIGKLFRDDRFAIGPQYKVDMGWPDQPTLSSYVGIAGLSRPYTAGWVGYDLPWQYSNKLDIGIDLGFVNNRIQAAVDVYKKDDKDLVLPVPIPTEYGYTGAYESGMWIQNTGVDVSLSAKILDKAEGLNWLFTANFNYNKNVLKALPEGLDEVVIGNRKLKVGKSVDGYWLLTNKGIYETDADVPVNPDTHAPMTYNGVALQGGDAKWADVNGDFVINNEDKTLQGHFMPKMLGGFGSQFDYKGWSFNFNFNYVLGRDILNQYASSRMDFINGQNDNNINSAKEITFWEERLDRSQYPMYNPWSSVIPYRTDQDLFLENGSYLKLRSLSVGYDLTKTNVFTGSKRKEKVFRKFLIYLSAANVFTISPFDVDDPELVQYNGIYSGYGLPIPRSFTFGVKIDL